VYRIDNDNDIQYVLHLNYLINSTSNGEQLHFSCGDINYIVDCFLNGFGVRMDMSNKDYYIVSNANIKNNDN